MYHSISLVCILCFLSFQFPSAQDSTVHKQNKISFGSDIYLKMKNFDQCIILSKGPVLQPDIWTAFNDITLTAWGNLLLYSEDENRWHFDEADLIFDYAYSIRSLTIKPSFALVLMPLETIDKFTSEFNLKITLKTGVLSFFAIQYTDLIAFQGAYYGEIGASAKYELNNALSMNSSLRYAWGSPKFNEINWGSDPKWSSQEFFIDYCFSWYILDYLYTSPFAECLLSFDPFIKEVNGSVATFNCGLSLGLEF